VPVSERYDPVSNPTGARRPCSTGRQCLRPRSETGFARRPFDNVGVQYGLQALNAGAITTRSFSISIKASVATMSTTTTSPHERVGTCRRFGAPTRAACSGTAVRTGVDPVFDLSGLVGVTDSHGYHYQWFHFATRQRMIEANGNGANHVMWRGNAIPTAQAWQLFIQWVENVRNDRSEANQRTKVIRDKQPAPLTAAGRPRRSSRRAADLQRLPDSQCNTVTLVCLSALHRRRALAADIIKCHLKPLDPATTRSPSAPRNGRGWRAFSRRRVRLVATRRAAAARGAWASFGPSPYNLVFDITRRTTDYLNDARRCRGRAGRGSRCAFRRRSSVAFLRGLG